MAKTTSCTRLYADDKGESHFEDIEFPLTTVQYAPPAPPVLVSDSLTATKITWMRFPANWHDEAHPSPRRQVFVVQSGVVEGWTSGGEIRRFYPGDCLLMEDLTGKGHGARPVDGEASALFIALD